MTLVARLTLVCLGAFTGACRTTPSQIVVILDTRLGVPCDLDNVEIEIAGESETETIPVALGAARLPETLTLVPENDGSAVTVTVRGRSGSTVIATARAAARFESGRALALPIVLGPECVPGPCEIAGPLAEYTSTPAPVTRRACDGDGGVAGMDGCTPSAEVCNRGDDDCDGRTDEGPLCARGERCGSAGCESAVERYRITSLPFASPASACSAPDHVTVTGTGNNWTAPVDLRGIDFRFYGVPVTEAVVSDNGLLSFGGSSALDVAPQALATASAPRPAVFGLWETLAVPPNRICVNLTGAPEAEVLQISFENVCYEPLPCSDANVRLTFSIFLFEAVDEIRLEYHDITDGASARARNARRGVTNGVPAGCATGCDAEGLCDGDPAQPCGYTEIRTLDPANPHLRIEPVLSE
jgi:hypothetical protein